MRWRLLTTHAVNTAADAWQIVDWYRLRWTIEQLFRLMKTDGLRLEDSQLETAGALLKLAAIATKAAARVLQLVQARDGKSGEPASVAFDPTQIEVLESLEVKYRAPAAIRANPPPDTISPGPRGSSPASAAGTDIRNPENPARSPC